MYSTPPKRAASASPGDGRPNKRHAPSSPEEGEVDDSPPPPRQATPPPKAKVPFPFKRKAPTWPSSHSDLGPPAGETARKDETLLVQHRAKRKPVLRSREEEAADDYNVLTKLGEGTFGEVHKAMHREKGNTVALKRILMHNEKEGMPVTALREIKILKSLHHPNIIDIEDMLSLREPLSVYMVFPYMDHDLAGLLENEHQLYMKQLIEGTEYMHRNHILHRDMKAANLLISNDGSLKIADFGLARAFDPRITQERKYTNCVVTRWYRPPELLLGARQYGGEVDMWGIGCVLAEMFWRRPILPGGSDIDQLEKIWQLCGTPNETTWPGWDLLPGCEGVRTWNNYNRRLRHVYEQIGHETVDLLDKLLACNPRERLTAEQALDHDYFWTDPLPADPKSLPKYEASHEFDKRGRREGAGAPPAVSYFVGGPNQRPLPPPMAQGPPQPMYRRPPPPREQFRFGPTNHGLPPPTNHADCASPISLRPGQPPPGMGQWPPSGPSSGMPPYPPPSMPPRRIHPSSLRHEYGGGAQLNYG
ncbi:kinase-like domain-containing protein [Fomitopsis serialis]|uniref:kinase-like domain-containing protein n=1 Tax=Fomitopsis serialis TaxID=139415 RepID=UPI0020080112|nr:kinase-like domain-containing protein [Neoantrodia serialis]KAH9932200.1 kinase-like domain-containing protein [Neoantrodia serialis]